MLRSIQLRPPIDESQMLLALERPQPPDRHLVPVSRFPVGPTVTVVFIMRPRT